MHHGAAPDLALVDETINDQVVPQHPIDDQALPQGAITDHKALGPQHLHGLLQHQQAWNDDLGPACINPGQGATLIRSERQHPLHQRIQRIAAELSAMQAAFEFRAIHGQQGRSSHGRAAGSHQHRRFIGLQPAAHLLNRWLQAALNEGPQKLDPLGFQRLLTDEIALQTHRPNAGAGERTGIAGISQDQLGGAAADIEDVVGMLGKVHA